MTLLPSRIIRGRRTPVLCLALQFWIDPGVVNGTFRITLGKTEWFHGLVLAISLTALDADVLGLHVILVFVNEPPFLIPEWNSLVHAVIPGLKALHSSLGRSAEH